MGWYRRRPVLVKAIQWFAVGDHPEVKPCTIPVEFEVCSKCGNRPEDHGLIPPDSLVCPGDWIINGKAEPYSCPDLVFDRLFEPASEKSFVEVECSECGNFVSKPES